MSPDFSVVTLIFCNQKMKSEMTNSLRFSTSHHCRSQRVRRPLRWTIGHRRESIFDDGCARDGPVHATSSTGHTHLVTRKAKATFGFFRAVTTDDFREDEQAEQEEDGHDAWSDGLDAWFGDVQESDWGETGSTCAGPFRVAVDDVVLRRKNRFNKECWKIYIGLRSYLSLVDEFG